MYRVDAVQRRCSYMGRVARRKPILGHAIHPFLQLLPKRLLNREI